MIDPDDYMPFGRYKGFTMEEIPEGYLRFWYDNNIHRKDSMSVEEAEVFEYIEQNLL